MLISYVHHDKINNDYITDQSPGIKQWTSGPTGTALTGSQQVQLQQIRDRDAEFDQDLDEIGEGIQDLHELAQGMGEEVARQNVMLNSVGQKIDGAHEHMVNVNAKMKETLEEVGRSSDKLCVDIMCIVSNGFVGYLFYLERDV
jgi:t-SNARE complex subunit (syntaxin)